jgi:hypothetical protein
MPDSVATYLSAIVDHDWQRLRGLLREDVVRVGPAGGKDTYVGREPYVTFLSGIMPSLDGYDMTVHAITWSEDRRRAFAELTETVTMGGAQVVTNEVLAITFDADGLITHVSIFTQQV